MAETINLLVAGRTLKDMGFVNIIMGKNGCGKSSLLRHIEEQKMQLNPNFTLVKYISPERAGSLQHDANMEQNINSSPRWLAEVRRANQVGGFKQMTYAEYKSFQLSVLEKIEADYGQGTSLRKFKQIVDEDINSLLRNVYIAKGDGKPFEFRTKETNTVVEPTSISSGESELVTLAIEVLSFAYRAQNEHNIHGPSLLLMDEPDVHLHPDLQDRLIRFIQKVVSDKPIFVIIATHSTAMLGALNVGSRVAFMRDKQTEITFQDKAIEMEELLPIFGAHPLSNIYKERPIFLVEGDDELRIWQQAIRVSKGRIPFWPCEVDGKQNLARYEKKANELIGAIYDDATAYSLRDRDNDPYEIDDSESIIRMRLFCRASENLIFADDVLVSLGTDWEQLKVKVISWLSETNNQSHPQYADMRKFADSGFNRITEDLKNIRNLIMAVIGSTLTWETAIGRAIGRLKQTDANTDTSLKGFLGSKLVSHLNLQ